MQRTHLFRLTGIALIVLGGGYFVFSNAMQTNKDNSDTANTTTTSIADEHAQVRRAYTSVASFTSEQFQAAFDNLSHPNIKPIIKRPALLEESPGADDYIYNLAEGRGYKLRPVAAGKLNTYKDIEVQELLIADWEALVNAAKEDGIEMVLVSGYRSVEEQTELFRERLHSLGLDPRSILSGSMDEKIDELLSMTAPPGYSRHHSGYTIDIETPGYPVFDQSPAELWLSENNYENAKKFGFIPSYPPDLPNQGPNPEPWEYVWVGKDITFESTED